MLSVSVLVKDLRKFCNCGCAV